MWHRNPSSRRHTVQRPFSGHVLSGMGPSCTAIGWSSVAFTPQDTLLRLPSLASLSPWDQLEPTQCQPSSAKHKPVAVSYTWVGSCLICPQQVGKGKQNSKQKASGVRWGHPIPVLDSVMLPTESRGLHSLTLRGSSWFRLPLPCFAPLSWFSPCKMEPPLSANLYHTRTEDWRGYTDDITTLICKIIAGNTVGNIFPI